MGRGGVSTRCQLYSYCVTEYWHLLNLENPYRQPCRQTQLTLIWPRSINNNITEVIVFYRPECRETVRKARRGLHRLSLGCPSRVVGPGNIAPCQLSLHQLWHLWSATACCPSTFTPSRSSSYFLATICLMVWKLHQVKPKTNHYI